MTHQGLKQVFEIFSTMKTITSNLKLKKMKIICAENYLNILGNLYSVSLDSSG